MTEESDEQKLAELDNLINDPGMPLCPARIWQLMGEISGHAKHLTEADHEKPPVAAEQRLDVDTLHMQQLFMVAHPNQE